MLNQKVTIYIMTSPAFTTTFKAISEIIIYQEKSYIYLKELILNRRGSIY